MAKGGGIARLYPRKAAQNLVMHVKSQQKANVCKVREPCIIACRFLNKHCQSWCCTVAHHCQTLNLIVFMFPSCSHSLSPSLFTLFLSVSFSRCFKGLIRMLFTTTARVSPSETPLGDTVVLPSFPGQIYFFS